jgi:hypothetical protein
VRRFANACQTRHVREATIYAEHVSVELLSRLMAQVIARMMVVVVVNKFCLERLR